MIESNKKKSEFSYRHLANANHLDNRKVEHIARVVFVVVTGTLLYLANYFGAPLF